MIQIHVEYTEAVSYTHRVNMADTELNARMKALTDEKESLKAQIADAQQAEVDLEEQAARRRQMWDLSLIHI